ncbi:MAG: phage portal protein [Gemmatimonadaceae bacterium]|nr:phage portal protein [Gemmatimonadaceae bacterium]
MSVVTRLGAALRAARAVLRGDDYTAARADPLFGDWSGTPRSANQTAESARKLRSRLRGLRRNNAIVQRYERLVEDNLVGEDGGPTLQAEPASARGINMALARQLERGFYDEWAPAAGADGAPLGEVMASLMFGWKGEGEALVELLEGDREFPFGVALRVYDVDLIDWDLERTPGRDGGGAIVRGVELNRYNRVVAVHVKTVHDNDVGRLGPGVRRRIPVDRCRLLRMRKQAGQVRGVTPFAPVMEILQMLGGLQNALVTQHRVAAAQGGFFETEQAGGNLVTAAAPRAPGQAGPTPKRIEMEAVPGLYRQLPPGVTYKPSAPVMPGNNYLDLYRTLIQDTAAALNVSPISLSGDLSQVNLSSLRGGLLTERQGWKRDAQTAIALFAWLYPAVVRGMVLAGYVRLPAGLSVADAARSSWHGRSWPFVDPQKDATALQTELEIGGTSLQRSQAQRGVDWRKVLDERAEELAYARQLGVPILGTGLESE